MRKRSFYPKLAAQNLKLNRKFYLPFILTCVASVAMFYIICFLANNKDIGGSLAAILSLGVGVIAIFSAIFLFYTNSFLMKRRQKEIGLYNILGMGKGNIGWVLFFETFFTGVISLVGGLAVGILLSKLVLLLLSALLKVDAPFGFEVSVTGIIYSAVLFTAIFLLLLVFNLIRIRLTNPAQLLRGGDVGEKEPKTKWVMAVLGIICLGVAYYIAISTESPLAALMLFFVAVVLVIVGTYFLFIATSVAILKGLKNKKTYYYQTRHFIPVSGMIYRMKQNAAGLASICILATMVLVMVSGTVCMYLGTEDAIAANNPREFAVSVYEPQGNIREQMTKTVTDALEENGITPTATVDYTTYTLTVKHSGEHFILDEKYYSADTDVSVLCFMTNDEYKRVTGTDLGLADGQAAVYGPKDGVKGSFDLLGKTYTVEQTLEASPVTDNYYRIVPDYYFVVVSAADMDSIMSGAAEKLNDFSSHAQWYYGVDFDGDRDTKLALNEELCDKIYAFESDDPENGFYSVSTNSREASRSQSYETTGGLLFLGLFLGLIFVLATVLIIYYKQLSEGYDDAERFEIMQKVGLSRPEIKKAIRSQILVVFFLPLVMAIIHIAFAFKMITKLLAAVSLTNIGLFALCTLGTVIVFALVYLVVYLLTARVYCKLVSE